MAKVKLTSGRIANFKCDPTKDQAFLWCAEVPGLGIRATQNEDAKCYIFQAKVNGKTMRLTIGKVSVWSIQNAQTEARRLQILIDQGNDPRQVKVENAAALESARLEREAEDELLKLQEARNALTFGSIWADYMCVRQPFWGERHYSDHLDAVHKGGEKRTRSKKLTEPGILASFTFMRLIDITPEFIQDWATVEGIKRPGRTRLASRLLSVFFAWCLEHKEYKKIISENPIKSKITREILGKPQKKNDALQREQLPAWFSAVRQLSNPIMSAYLQSLLLTGARPNELIGVKWDDVSFQWEFMTIRDKVEGTRIIPLPPYLSSLLQSLPKRNEFVFSSPNSKSGHLEEAHGANYKVCEIIGIDLTLHGLRRSFASLTEWVEMPAGIAAQIQGHAPQGVREQHYIRRPLDLLRMWHKKIEAWILEQAGIST